jgi:hypothetical protein
MEMGQKSEAQMLQEAQEAWNTPNETVTPEKKDENKETFPENEKVDTGVEIMENNPIDTAIEKESIEFESNSAAVKRALEDVGGVEGLQTMLSEIPEDKKTEISKEMQAVFKKIDEEYAAFQEKLQKDQAEYDKLNDEYAIATTMMRHDKDMHTIGFEGGKKLLFSPFKTALQETDTEMQAGLMTASALTGLSTIAGLWMSATEGGKLLYDNFRLNKEERKHQKKVRELAAKNPQTYN